MWQTLLSGSAQFVDGFIVTSKFDEALSQYFVMVPANFRWPCYWPMLKQCYATGICTKRKAERKLEAVKKQCAKVDAFPFSVNRNFIVDFETIIPVVFNAGFQESATIFNIYLLLIVSRLMSPQTILNGLKISKPIMLASLFELIVNVTFSLVFVQFWGIAGIAMATFIAYLFEKIYLAAEVKQRLSIPLSAYLPKRIFLIYSAGIVVIFIFAELIF